MVAATHPSPSDDDIAAVHDGTLAWYASHARDLPWRRPGTPPWHVLISELMLQQTPVSRVLPVYEQWVARWPLPADLAAVASGEAVRAWGRLGYPRRALRLHACAVTITECHAGTVPSDLADLRALPGVGDYTAAAIASFAFGQRHAVLDTNVRRVLGRVAAGEEFPKTSVSVAERRLADVMVPTRSPRAARWAVAVMELGALVCTARSPRCAECPIREHCRWRLSGYPAYDGPVRRGQAWAGTDRQCRGRLLAVLRDDHAPVTKHRLDAVWDDAVQRERALDGLVADELVAVRDDGRYTLPT